MRCRTAVLLLLLSGLSSAVIIDRIAIVVGDWIVKDSDIERDIRATSFLNGRQLEFTKATRKESASRLIDQLFIRHEIFIGDYRSATSQEAEKQLEQLKKGQFKSLTSFDQTLRQYGLTETELLTQFQLQLTVLHFIEVRFKPAVLVTDDDIEKYYRDHKSELTRQYPGKALDDLRDQIRDILTGDRVNQQFFAWLDEQRKSTKIEYREESLA